MGECSMTKHQCPTMRFLVGGHRRSQTTWYCRRIPPSDSSCREETPPEAVSKPDSGGRGWTVGKPRSWNCRGFARLQPRPPRREEFPPERRESGMVAVGANRVDGRSCVATASALRIRFFRMCHNGNIDHEKGQASPLSVSLQDGDYAGPMICRGSLSPT